MAGMGTGAGLYRARPMDLIASNDVVTELEKKRLTLWQKNLKITDARLVEPH